MENPSNEVAQTPLQPPEKWAFDFVKSNNFRVVTASGVIGGITPTGQISVSVYNERPPIPKRVVHRVLPDGSLGPEIEAERECRDSILREVEFCMILDHDTAMKMAVWLRRAAGQLAEMFEQQQSESQEQQAKENAS